KDNGGAIGAVCSQLAVLCRELGLFTRAVVAIDGSKCKAVNNGEKNYTVAKVTGRTEQVIARYLRALDRANLEESDIAEAKSGRLKEKIAGPRRILAAGGQRREHGRAPRVQLSGDEVSRYLCQDSRTISSPRQPNNFVRIFH